MALEFHGVVQNSPDDDQVRFLAVNQKVARAPDDPDRGTGAFPAQAQVPRAHRRAKLRAFGAADPVRLRGDIAQRGGDQRFIAFARLVAELFVRPDKNVEDV